MLYIGLCLREKGLFDAVEAVALANRALAGRNVPVRVQLEVAGRFYLPAEQQEFEKRIQQPDLKWSAPSSGTGDSHEAGAAGAAVRYHGFVQGTAKDRLFRETDCLIFPTYYAAESFGLVLIEAMAHGSDVIATRWRNIPELLPPGYPGLVPPRDPQALAECILGFLEHYQGGRLRRHYEEHHSLAELWSGIESALRELETSDPAGTCNHCRSGPDTRSE
jgi:glycosyltransferase involved in cell wall biosynthesis